MKNDAFSLVETMLALGVFALCGVGLLAGISAGLHSATGARDDYSLHLVAANLESRVRAEPGWPAGLGSAPRDFHLDAGGMEVPREEALYKATMRAIANPNWNATNAIRWIMVELSPAKGGATQRFVLAQPILKK